VKKEAMLYEKLAGGKVRCFLCSHRCEISDAKYGVCGVRKNEKGRLYTFVYGEVIASHVDPIEKKPLYHFLPGSGTYSIATVGCNFHCGFCQNWQISQASIRDTEPPYQPPYQPRRLVKPTYAVGKAVGKAVPEAPEEVVREAKKSGCKSISYTYTEPTIFFEYAYDTAKIAKKEGLYNTFVTNGYMTPEALDTIRPYLDACNVDLKSFSEDTYKKVCGGRLKPVLRAIRHMKNLKLWVEITTLIVPGMNDTDEEIRGIAQFIAETDTGIPWHISRFHPDFKFRESLPTSPEALKKAASIGKKAGLKYIYLGNISEETDTFCHNCGKILIERAGYAAGVNNIIGSKCPECNAVIEGVWK